MNRNSINVSKKIAGVSFAVVLAVTTSIAQQTTTPSAAEPVSQTTPGAVATTPLTKDELKAQQKAHKQQEKAADANAKAAKSQAKAKKDQDKALQEQEKTAGTAPKN